MQAREMHWLPQPARISPWTEHKRARRRQATTRWRRKLRGMLPIVALAAAGCLSVILAWYAVSATGWGFADTLRHLASAPNCDAARTFGLAPAGRGQPGYWPQHDRDGDGVACEPWRYRR